MNNNYKYSDVELIGLLRSEGQESDKAFHIIYQKYSSKIFAFCLYKCTNKEDAEEILQDVWIKFYNSIKSGKFVDNISPYLFTIARNLCISKYRNLSAKKQIKVDYLDENLIEKFADPFHFQDEIEKEELTEIIKLAIYSLDDNYRETLALYWFGGLNYEQISEICNETEACIRTRFARGFNKLVNILKPYLIDSTK